MVDDLISNYDLIGMSKSEIEELLGEAENEDSKSIMSYNLGPCRGFGVDYGVLIVELKNGQVVGIEKRCH